MRRRSSALNGVVDELKVLLTKLQHTTCITYFVASFHPEHLLNCMAASFTS